MIRSFGKSASRQRKLLICCLRRDNFIELNSYGFSMKRRPSGDFKSAVSQHQGIWTQKRALRFMVRDFIGNAHFGSRQIPDEQCLNLKINRFQCGAAFILKPLCRRLKHGTGRAAQTAGKLRFKESDRSIQLQTYLRCCEYNCKGKNIWNMQADTVLKYSFQSIFLGYRIIRQRNSCFLQRLNVTKNGSSAYPQQFP